MTVPIVVIAGQSNAVGRGTITLIPNYVSLGYSVAFPAVQQRYKTSDAPDDPPTFGFDEGPESLIYIPSGNGVFGVEASMCRRLISEGYAHAMAKMAITSSSLGGNWAVDATYPTVGDNLFTQFLDFLADAEDELDGTIAELVWIQGEADAGNSGFASAYVDNFTAFAAAFRVAFPGVPITINRLNSRAGGSFNATIRAAQETIARTVPGIRLVYTDDLPLIGAHYTETGFLVLGERIAQAILEGRDGLGLRNGVRLGLGVRSGPRFGTGQAFPPVADFTTSAAALEVTFTDASTVLSGSIVAWAWDFGDGDTASTQNPVHTYDAAGTYSVTLVVTGSNGASARLTRSISVLATLWTIDATSGKATPIDATEWAALVADESLVVGSPEHLWLFQDASGNLAAAVGGKTLTMTGTPLYQQTETGWARRFIASNTGAAAANRNAANATMSANTVSTMLLMYARIVQPAAGHQRMSYGGASSNAFEGIASSNNIRYRTGASASNGSTSHVGTVYPYVIVHDPSGTGRMGLFTPLERKTFDAGTSPAYAARSGSTVTFTFSLGTDATSNTIIGYGAGWSGASVQFADITAMENAVRALLQGLGWTVSW